MDNNIVAEIKSKIDIIEFIGSYTTLKKAGKHYSAICPFHQEKSPSFVVSPEREMWYCFGACHEGGDVISFIMKWENISFYEALKELAYRAGVQLTDVKFNDRDYEKKDILFRINHMACEYFQHILQNTKFGAKAKEYLLTRDLNEKIIKTFQIGYAPTSWDSLLKFLKAKGFSEADILRTGLIVRSDRGSHYDRFRGRIVFPIKDVRDNIIAFSGRILEDRPNEPKYINVPETEIYHKRESLYGIHITKDGIRKSNSVMVVEGEFDVIIPYQHGVDNVVAIKGSSVTREHLRILKRYAQKFIFCLDADAAGTDAVMRAIKEAEDLDVEIHVMLLTVGKDPDEAVRKDNVAFKEALKKSVPAYDYLIKAISDKYPDESPFEKKKAADELVPFLHMMKNPIVLGYYVKMVANVLDTSEESVRELLAIYTRKQLAAFRPGLAKKEIPEEDMTSEERKDRYLIWYLLQQEEPMSKMATVFNILEPQEFSTPALKKLAEAFVKYIGSHTSFSVKGFAAQLPGELLPTFDDIYLNSSGRETSEFEDVELRALESKRAALERKMNDIPKTDDDSNDDLLVQINADLVRVRRLIDIRSGKTMEK